MKIDVLEEKLLLVVGVILISTLLVWVVKIDPSTYGSIVTWATGAYVAGNTAEKTGMMKFGKQTDDAGKLPNHL